MKTRINLTIDESLLDKIKHYASSKERSVSDLVESYFRSVIDHVSQKKSLVNMIEDLPKPEIEERGDLKKRYMEERREKYGA